MLHVYIMQERLRVDRRLRGLNTPFAHNCFSNVTVCRLGVAMFPSACTMRYGINCSNFFPRKWLSEKVTNVPAACNVFRCELQTLDSIPQPKESHVHAFGSLGVDGVIR